MATVEGVGRFETVADGVVDEKIVIFCEIALKVASAVPTLAFFPFLVGAGDCDMDSVILDVVGDIVEVSEGPCAMKT